MSESQDKRPETENEPLPEVEEWIKEQPFITTADIEIPTSLLDQVIGQEDAVVVVRKAAEQRRHVMLIGEPGTGRQLASSAECQSGGNP